VIFFFFFKDKTSASDFEQVVAFFRHFWVFCFFAQRLIVVGPFEGVLGHTEAQRFQPMIQINIGRVLLSVRITFAQCVVSAAVHSGHGRRSSPLQAHSTGKRLDGLEKQGATLENQFSWPRQGTNTSAGGSSTLVRRDDEKVNGSSPQLSGE
jgi:hypothetical protein